MNYYINNLLYDSSKDLDHWKIWDDEVWIVRMRDRLPLNHQTRDHVADCNHLIDKLILEVWYAKDNTEQKYIDELLQMEMEIVSIYIKDQTSIDNLVDRLIRRIGKDASSRKNEITLW